MKLTRREKTMIGALLLVLLAAVFVLVLRSFTTKIDAKQAELDELKVTSNGIRAAVESVDKMRSEIPVLQEGTKSLKSQFYSVQKNRQFDASITSLADRCGLEPVSLVIGDSLNGSIEPYVSFAESTGVTEEAGYIWSNTAKFVASGTEQELYAFLDSVAADPALRVSGLSYEAPLRSGGDAEYDIDLVIYMCDKGETA